MALEAQLRGLKVACVEQDSFVSLCAFLGRFAFEPTVSVRKTLLQEHHLNPPSFYGLVSWLKKEATYLPERIDQGGLLDILQPHRVWLFPFSIRFKGQNSSGLQLVADASGSRYLVKGLVKLFSPASISSPAAAWNDARTAWKTLLEKRRGLKV